MSEVYEPNSILSDPALDINPSEQTLPHKTRRILAQLRTGKSPILRSYLHKIDPASHSSPTCPLCNSQDHITQHLFSCPKIITTLTARDLWDDVVAAAALLQQWDDVLWSGGGGLGPALCEAGWAIE